MDILDGADDPLPLPHPVPLVSASKKSKKEKSGKKGKGGVREEIRQLQEELGVDDSERTPQVGLDDWGLGVFQRGLSLLCRAEIAFNDFVFDPALDQKW